MRYIPGGRIKLVIPDHIEARDLYVIASEQGVQIRRMNQRRDSLEDIFLRAMDNDRGKDRKWQSISATTRAYTGIMTPAWTRVLVLARYAFEEAWSSKITVGLFIFCLLPCIVSLANDLSCKQSACQGAYRRHAGQTRLPSMRDSF